MEEESDYDENTVEIKGLPDFSETIGCYTGNDEFTHLGRIFISLTACGKPLEGMISDRHITVNCPECVAEIRYRGKHPEAAKKEFGVVTHKK
ncbi:MAG: hypothetical protein ACKKMP_00025 [Candidatus Nealsonbacteria bacterium]